jgi:hypothetical protein
MHDSITELYGFVLIPIFGAWFALSVALQFAPKWLVPLKLYDHFSLLPGWTFFAPNPGTSDTHLLFRDRLIDPGMTPWREVPIRRSPLRAFWHPQKRAAKTLRDLETHLLQLRDQKATRESVFLSIPYLTLINYISSFPRANFTVSTQFTMVRSCGYWGGTPSAIIFLSELHAVNEVDDVCRRCVS